VIVNNIVAWSAPPMPEEAKTMTDYLVMNFGN